MDAWSSSLYRIDAEGNMLPLPRTEKAGGAFSFKALVESVCKDIRPRSLLDEWLRKGFVVLDSEDRVVVVRPRPTGLVEGPAGTGLFLSEMLADLLHGFDRVYIHGETMPGFGYQVEYRGALRRRGTHAGPATPARPGPGAGTDSCAGSLASPAYAATRRNGTRISVRDLLRWLTKG